MTLFYRGSSTGGRAVASQGDDAASIRRDAGMEEEEPQLPPAAPAPPAGFASGPAGPFVNCAPWDEVLGIKPRNVA